MSTEDEILAEMYDLNPDQLAIYHRLHGLVADALEQYALGYAVDVEQQTADLAKELCR